MDNIQTHQKELCNKLWSMANALRGNMEAYEFKNYILGMIFYYYLSDRTEKYMAKILHDDGLSYEEAWNNLELKEAVIEESLRDLGFVIEPQYLFRKMVNMVENRSFDIEFLQKAINNLMASTQGNESEEDFDGLFSDMQLDSTKLGHTVKDRSSVMAKIISALDEIEFGVEDTKIDILGNAYEYLIGQFAATAGKKAGEFYTPAAPAELLCRLACYGLTDVKAAADPTCGSGSLLLRLKKYVNVRNYYGQELTSTTYNLARMNMILRGIPVCVLVLKKNRNANANNILFIDASKDYESGKNQNILRDCDIDKIVETYVKREDVEKYAHVATMEEIVENGFNLNIPRYVDTFEKEEEIDLNAVSAEIKQLQTEIKSINTELKPYFDELGLDFPFAEEN